MKKFLAGLGAQPTNTWVPSRYRPQGHISRSRELRYLEAIGIGFDLKARKAVVIDGDRRRVLEALLVPGLSL